MVVVYALHVIQLLDNGLLLLYMLLILDLAHCVELFEFVYLVTDHRNVLLDILKDLFYQFQHLFVTNFLLCLKARDALPSHENTVFFDFIVKPHTRLLEFCCILVDSYTYILHTHMYQIYLLEFSLSCFDLSSLNWNLECLLLLTFPKVFPQNSFLYF